MSKGSQSARHRRRATNGTKENQESVGLGHVDLNQNETVVDVGLESVDDEDKESYYAKTKNKVSGSFTLISVTVLISVVLLFATYMSGRLPKPLMESDIASNPISFIEERARRDLHNLTSVGVRVAGSIANDVYTVNQFLHILESIKRNASSVYNIEFEEQRPTGMFWYDDDDGSTSSYSKIANVVAKLEPADPAQRTESGILLNCHFDTKPGSPGAMDNMISCSVMLEILRVLSSQPNLVLKNTIVFLFNGAEELGLQGAHGFARAINSSDPEEGHRWSQNLKVFMNLEGAGGGGREILFQVTGGKSDQTGWLLKAYKQCPRPYGTVVAEEAFKNGFIPSDTDFRIFRDFKDLAGFDIAFIKNGWVYHTKWDTLSEIPPGSIQHMGANALAIVKYLGNQDLTSTDSAKEMVFFDVLGAFMISYSKTVGIVINVFVSIAVIAVIIYYGGWKPKSFLTYLWYIGSTIVGWAASIGVAALIAVFLQGSGYPKPFYSYPSLSLVLFGPPTIIAQILVYSIWLKSSPKDTWLAGKLTLAIVLLISTFITRGAYILVPPLLFGPVGWFSARYLMRGWPRGIMVTYMIVGELVPLIMSSYIVITLLEVFVPILGRAGSNMHGNLYMGVMVAAVLAVLAMPGLVSLFVNYDKSVMIACLLISILLVNPMIVFGFIGKIPYLEKTPMRVSVSDLERTWYSSNGTQIRTENGYWFWPLDADTDNLFPEFSKTVKEVQDVEDVKLDYETCENLYCAQPFFWPTTKRIKKVHWIPKDTRVSADLSESVRMDVIENSSLGAGRRLVLEFSGPATSTIILSPHQRWDANISIQALSENRLIERPGELKWKGRKVYYIFHGRGYEPSKLRITLHLNQTDSILQQDGKFLHIQHTGLFLDLNPGTASPEFLDFLSRFPSWAFTGMSWTSVMKMYEID